MSLRVQFFPGAVFAGALLLGACARSGPPPSDIGGAFRMVDQNGRSVDQGLLKGKWSAVYFGYTFCPDTCPTTLSELAQAQTALGAKSRNFQVVFVSVDPARDTPAQMKTYLSSPAFPKGAIGLTGTPAEVAAIAKNYHVFYQRVGNGPDYSMDHTSVVYLMDPKGRFVQPVDTSRPPSAIAGEIAGAMAQD
ncbi:MAG: SCO family protein [Caulobacteraceae bacterium]